MVSAPSAAAAIGAEHSVVHWSGIYLQRKMGERGIPALTPLHQRHRALDSHSSTHLPRALWCWMKEREMEGMRGGESTVGDGEKTGRDQGGEVSSSEGRVPGPPSDHQPRLLGNAWPLPRSWGEWKRRRWSVRVPSGSLCGEWSETARGCICSAWTTPQLPSVCLFIEMKWKRERKRESA